MKLHSDTLTEANIREALETARSKGNVTGGLQLVRLEQEGSRSRANGFEVRLGVTYKDGVHNRRTNDGTGNYAATWHEWGWFILELFALDNGMTFGPYKSEKDFHEQTRFAF